MKERIKSWLTSPTRVGKAAVILMITMIASNLLGLARNVILSKNIALNDLDAYYAAFTLPDMIFNILIVGTVGAAFIPVFNQLMTNKEEQLAWRVANNFLNISVLIIIVSLLVIFVFMDPLIRILVPGFDAQKMEMTIKLARIMLFSPLLFAISYILGGVLNSFKSFISYAIAPLLYNVAIIIGAILAPRYDSIEVIAYAVVLGALAHFLIQVPPALALGWRWRIVFDLSDEYMRKIFKLMLPRSIALAINQITIVAFTLIGSTLAGGAIAIYKLTNDLQSTPTMIFGTSLAVALFPYMSERANKNDDNGLKELISRTISLLLFVLIPITVLAIVFDARIIRLYLALGTGFERWDDTVRAIYTFSFFAISIVAQSLITFLARVYFAKQDTMRPMYFSLISAIISVGCALALVPHFDVVGLAMAFSIGSWLNCILLIIYLRKHIDFHFFNLPLLISVTKTAIISVIAGIFALIGLRVFNSNYNQVFLGFNDHTVSGLIGQTVSAGILALVVFVVLAWFAQRREMLWVLKGKKNFIKR